MAAPVDPEDAHRHAPEWQIVHIHPAAPAKPAWGAPCNGCGVCCLSEPCPVGMVYSRRRHGACDALRWDDSLQLYRCGLAGDPLELLGWPGAPQGLTAWLGRRFRRFIAAGAGCDAALSVQRGDEPPGSG